jgi:hypothetical protein
VPRYRLCVLQRMRSIGSRKHLVSPEIGRLVGRQKYKAETGMKIELIRKIVVLAALAAVVLLAGRINRNQDRIETRQIICSRSADYRPGQDREGDNR